MSGVKSNNISNRVPVPDELVVNRSGSTGLQRVSDLATQLAGAGAIATALKAAEEGYVVAISWSALNNIDGTRSGQPARIPSTVAGTHTDPVTEATVPNSGEYIWSVSPRGWRRVSDVIDAPALKEALDLKTDLTFFEDLLRESRSSLFPASTAAPMMDDYWQTVVQASPSGDVNMGVNNEGVARIAALLDQPGIPALLDDFLWAAVTEAGEVLFGYHFDRGWVDASTILDVQPFDMEIEGARQVYALAAGTRVAALTFGETDASAIGMDGSYARYAELVGGKPILKREEVLARTSLAAGVTSIAIHVVYGQSLGDGSSSTPPKTVAAVSPGRALMFNVGPAVRGSLDANLPTPDQNRHSWVDLLESGRETPASQIGRELTRANGFPSNKAALLVGCARGGTAYTGLRKGTQPFANIISSVRRARIMAALNGLAVPTPTVSFIQGENDIAAPLATYLANLVQLQSDLTAELARYLDTPGEVLLFVDQISNWSNYNTRPPKSDVPLAQLQAALENPSRIFCVCPKYFLATSVDGIHLTADSSATLGAYHGRAVRQTLAGSPWRPLHIASALRAGASIVLTYAGGDAATDITLDTSLVTNPGNYGFEWSQTGGTLQTLASVTKTGTRQVTVMLSGDPGAPSSSSIGYACTGVVGQSAGPTSGPRGNIRDNSLDTTTFGDPMFNWACHQLINL